MLLACLGTLIFLKILHRNLNQEMDIDGLTDEEIDDKYWWDIFGPIIAIAVINIGAVIICLF